MHQICPSVEQPVYPNQCYNFRMIKLIIVKLDEHLFLIKREIVKIMISLMYLPLHTVQPYDDLQNCYHLISIYHIPHTAHNKTVRNSS